LTFGTGAMGVLDGVAIIAGLGMWRGGGGWL
jgi:hypothetical protein